MKRLTANQIVINIDKLNCEIDHCWNIKQGKLTKQFVFFDFAQAFEFMKKVAVHAEKINHHPEWSNIYNIVVVALTTHEAGGLTEKDFELALFIETVASQ